MSAKSSSAKIAKPSKREAELAAEIRAMTKLSKDASGKNYGAAVAALAKVSQLKSELDRLRSEREAEQEPDPVARAGRLRRLATEAGSYVAAANLAKLEAELTMARDAAASAAKGDGLEGATDEEIIGVIEGAILALPEGLVLRIRDAALARLGGAKLRLVGAG